MKKFLNTSIFCLIIMATFMLSACSLGGYDVTFVDYNGTVISTKTYSSNETVTNSNSPRPGSREGFTFVQWTHDNPTNIVPTSEVNTENIMFAKYRLNPNDAIFSQSGSKLDWYGGTSTLTSSFTAGVPKTILINDGTGLTNIGTINILGVSQSGFSLADFKVYDANGYEVNRNSSILNIWAVASAPAGTYSYALVITAEYSGSATITVTEA